MKQLKYSKKISQEAQSFVNLIELYCNKLNKEYAKNIYNLCKKIAEGENLDFEMIKNKYLNKSVPKDIETPENVISDEIISEDKIDETSSEDKEIIFDKIIIDNNNYYYENKENGKIYDSSSKRAHCT